MSSCRSLFFLEQNVIAINALVSDIMLSTLIITHDTLQCQLHKKIYTIIKSEVHNLSQFCQSRTKSWSQATCIKKFGKVWLCGFWDMHVDRQTCCSTPHFSQGQNNHRAIKTKRLKRYKYVPTEMVQSERVNYSLEVCQTLASGRPTFSSWLYSLPLLPSPPTYVTTLYHSRPSTLRATQQS